jgi:hypothetical protein
LGQIYAAGFVPAAACSALAAPRSAPAAASFVIKAVLLL